MPWGEIGVVLVVLVVLFIVGEIWFHFVEGVQSGIKRLWGKKEPTAWHMLPPEQEREETKHV